MRAAVPNLDVAGLVAKNDHMVVLDVLHGGDASTANVFGGLAERA